MSVAGIILYIAIGISFIFWLICLFLGTEFLGSSDSFVVSILFLAFLIDLLNSFSVHPDRSKGKKLIYFIGTLLLLLIIALGFYFSVIEFIELL